MKLNRNGYEESEEEEVIMNMKKNKKKQRRKIRGNGMNFWFILIHGDFSCLQEIRVS